MRPPDPLADLLPELQPASMTKQRQAAAAAGAAGGRARPHTLAAPAPVPFSRPLGATPPALAPSSLRADDAFAALTGGGGGDGKAR